MRKFLAGFMICGAMHSLQQDIMGKEKYIQAVNLLWMDEKITVPLAIFTILIAMILLLMPGSEQ